MAAGERGALGEADEPGSRPGNLRLACGQDRRGVAHLDRKPVSGGSLDAQVDRCRGCVLACIGQGLLDDSQRMAADGVRDGSQVGNAQVGAQTHAGHT